MKTEFRKAVLPRELRSLVEFDNKIFSTDRFRSSDWKAYETYWLLVDGKKIGCCAFQKDVTFSGNDDINPSRRNSLYIATTGILPRFQRLGFGHLLKSWQIAYARHHGFARMVTTTRKRNIVMVALNKRHGFKIIRMIREYYSDPPDSGVMMELVLIHHEKPPLRRRGPRKADS